jgi:hypothetical protein
MFVALEPTPTVPDLKKDPPEVVLRDEPSKIYGALNLALTIRQENEPEFSRCFEHPPFMTIIMGSHIILQDLFIF